jgi:hypothetical protein
LNNKPVAWHYPDGKPDQCTTDKEYAEKEPAWTPMYYKHEWIGLTGEEIEASKPTRSNDAVVWELAVEWAEAKLKEKNNG